MKTCYLLLLLLTCAWGTTMSAQDIDQATEMMKKEQYAEAIAKYKEIIESGKTSPELNYNIGIAYHQNGELGYALWHFLLADKMGMESEALDHNIALTREKRIDDIEIIEPFFLSRWWNIWKGIMGANLWAMISLLLLSLGIFGWGTWRLHPERNLRKKGFVYGSIILILAVITAITAVSTARQYISPNHAILLVDRVELRSAPEEVSAAILDLHEGTEVRILDEIGDWVKIRLLNGQTGWLLKSDLGFV